MKIVILGAGLAGTTTAYFLARQGCDVIVIDRQDVPAAEASFGTAGLVHASLAEPWNSPATVLMLLRSIGLGDAPLRLHFRQLPSLIGWGARFLQYSRPALHLNNTLANARLALHSQRQLAVLRTSLCIDFDHAAAGLIKLFTNGRRLDAALATAAALEPLGIPFQALSPDALRAHEPLLADVQHTIAGGVRYPADESGCPAQFTRALAAHAAELGVTFLFGQRITGIERRARTQIAAITVAGRVDADACVIAGGAESALLARKIGLHLPIRPVKGYVTTVPIVDGAPVPRQPLADDGRRIAITRLGKRLRVTGSAEFAGFDYAVSSRQVQQVIERACAVIPALAVHFARGGVQGHACLRPVSVDGLPLLGATPVPGVFVNTGAGHLGWTLAAGAGQLVADAVLGRATELPIEPYAITRFERKCTRRLAARG
jgi:D-amino-acid dehydrogenase